MEFVDCCTLDGRIGEDRTGQDRQSWGVIYVLYVVVLHDSCSIVYACVFGRRAGRPAGEHTSEA